MILIADGGSTKIEWQAVDGRKSVKKIITQGLNPVMLSRDEMSETLDSELRPAIEGMTIDKVHYYGAGCFNDETCRRMARVITQIVGPGADVSVNTDLLGAARSLCGDKPGLACIMGTGSNSCYFNGERIIDNVSPLGFILGDEGSGAVLGKELIGALMKNRLPKHLRNEFFDYYQLDLPEIINRVYRNPTPNRFLASFTPFIHAHISEPGIRTLVLDQFVKFFERNVSNYSYTGLREVNFTGSIAYHFRDILSEAAEITGYVTGLIVASPMQGLVEFHSHG